MSERGEEGTLEEAIAWRIRLDGASGDMWVRFTEWLEQGPENAAAYDRVMLADDGLETLGPARIASNDDGYASAPHTPRRWPLAALSALAALFLCAILAYPLLNQNGGQEMIATAPGQTRSIPLADGSRIELNGATRLALDPSRPRYASLESGQATFNIVHDPVHPFTVQAGDATLRDLGTEFDVVREGGRLDVAVAKGAVLYDPDAEAIRLPAGTRLRVAAGSDTAIIGQVAPEAVGAWRSGRLVYDGTPLGVVAADIGRTTGVPVSVDPELAGRSFTGVIRIERDRNAFFHSLGDLLGTRVEQQGKGWRLSAGGRAAR